MWACLGCKEEIEEAFGACWNCGTGRDGTPDREFRRADEPDTLPVAQSVGVSRFCPACKGRDYKTRQEDGLLTVSLVRECRACGTRYTPPTNQWVACVLLGVGVPVVSTCLMLLGYAFYSEEVDLWTCFGIAMAGFAGAAAIRRGALALWYPGEA